jgi:membrane-associated protein
MDFAQLADLFLHLDTHLASLVGAYGPWVYGLLFLIIFIETGVVVMPFLPGDSLLFVAGTIAGIGALSLPLLVAVLFAAAVLGDNSNYWIGRMIGPRVFRWEQSRLFNKAAFDRTHAFYERYGPMTIIIARFLPFVRTFSPFVAGVGAMTYSRFLMFDLLGGVIWVGGITTLGYLIGNLPWVKAHFSLITLSMILIPGLPAVFEVSRQLLRRRRNAG